MDNLAPLAITLPELAATYSGDPRSARNHFYLHPEDFPPAAYLPGCRGPRFMVADIPEWLEGHKAKPTSPPPPAPAPAPKGRPRKASPAQITLARHGKGGAA